MRFENRDFCLIFLYQIGSAGILVERTGLEPGHPNADQIARDVVAIGQMVRVSPATNSCATCA